MAKKTSSAARAQPSFDFDLVKKVTEFMKENDLVELDIRSGTSEMRLRRGSMNAPTPQYAPSFAPSALPAAPATKDAAPAAPKKPDKNYHLVTSPFVGTFYRAAGPNQDSFVEVGQVVSVGDALCIVEAMKLMNEIESDTKGRIVSVLVDNATPVEFGEALFEIEVL